MDIQSEIPEMFWSLSNLHPVMVLADVQKPFVLQ